MPQGRYSDDRRYDLPAGWEAASAEVLAEALFRTRIALGLLPGTGPSVSDRLEAYYATEGHYAGATFLEAQPQDDFDVTAADLWAVTTLSIDVPALAGRHLLLPGARRASVHRQLRLLEPNRPITELDSAVLDAMWTLHHCFSSVMATEEKGSVWWVFAAKLCARKRPDLFPVRDNLVCNYLSGGNGVGGKAGQLGWFSTDIQVFAFLMTSKDIVRRLGALYDDLKGDPTIRLDTSMLRLLDAVLWTAARANVQHA